MSRKDDFEKHIIEIDGDRYRITNDPHTGDWAVEEMSKEYPQPIYVKTKMGAIDYCLEKSGLQEYGGYRIAPDRTSA